MAVRERGAEGDKNYLPTGEETQMDALIRMVDEHAGVAMAGFVSDGLGLSLQIEDPRLLIAEVRYFVRTSKLHRSTIIS